MINRLAEARLAVCDVAEGADIAALAAGLAKMNIHTSRRRTFAPDLIPEVRARHGLSQREFAAMLGIDVGALRNWEQGRNKPDVATLGLITAFDTSPAIIEHATLEPIV